MNVAAKTGTRAACILDTEAGEAVHYGATVCLPRPTADADADIANPAD